MGKYEMGGESAQKTQVEPVMYCNRLKDFNISNYKCIEYDYLG